MRVSIPEATKKQLRKEVGFGCPVRGCGNPYLEYHHFDPPIRERSHNEPEGMIALCPHHHRKADGGAFTVSQLKSMKQVLQNSDNVRGNLDWMRNNVMVCSGSNIYYNSDEVLSIDGKKVIYFSRDIDGYLLLNVNMLSLSGEKRVKMVDNSWEAIGDPVELRSPPSGKELEISYGNGDRIFLRFREFETATDCHARYKLAPLLHPKIVAYPVTALEIEFAIGGTNINFLSGQESFFSNTFLEGGCAINIKRSGYNLK